MASKIGLSDAEYTAYVKNLKNSQKDLIDAIDSVISQLQALNRSKGGLQSDNVSKNLVSLAGSISKIKISINKTFETERTAVENFATTMKNYDTVK